MSDPNKNSSSDDSWQKLAIPYDEFDVALRDIDEAELVDIGEMRGIENLSAASFSSPIFPVSGLIYGRNIRYMISLVCQRARKPTSRAINVWFLVDTGSPFTCLTVKSLEAIFGQGNATHNVYELAIQDQSIRIECRISKEHFREVNVLGADAMRKLKLSITVNWEEEEFQLVN